jgi:hypothetical protein
MQNRNHHTRIANVVSLLSEVCGHMQYFTYLTAGRWRKLYNYEFRNLHSSPNDIIKMTIALRVGL